MTDNNHVYCPWCGAKMEYIDVLVIGGNENSEYYYECPECEARSPLANSEEEVLNAALARPLQKPLTLEEACWSEEPCVYFEFGRSGFAPIKAALIAKKQDKNGYEVVILGGAKPILFFANMYGSVLRCWATKPSDEEREAAKWDDK